MTEALFLERLWLAAGCRRMVGLGAPNTARLRVASSAISCARRRRRELRAELEHRFEAGGLEEALLRALIYVRLPEGASTSADYSVLKSIRESRAPANG